MHVSTPPDRVLVPLPSLPRVGDARRDKKTRGLARAFERLERLLGRGAVAVVGGLEDPAAPGARAMLRLPTSLPPLDDALSGGLPRGRLVEIFGAPGAGKTALALRIIAGVQARGGVCAFVDADGTLDADTAALRGVRRETLVIARPRTGEEGLQVTDELLRAGAVDVVVIDSVAALLPRAELSRPLGEAPAGLHARLMSQGLRRLQASAHTSKAVVIFVNQVRRTFDDDGRGSDTTTGGSALHFHAALRLSVESAHKPEQKRHALRVTVVKSRSSAEGAVVEVAATAAAVGADADAAPAVA